MVWWADGPVLPWIKCMSRASVRRSVPSSS